MYIVMREVGEEEIIMMGIMFSGISLDMHYTIGCCRYSLAFRACIFGSDGKNEIRERQTSKYDPPSFGV